MKQIRITECLKGDVITKKFELHGREAFEVTQAPPYDKTVKVKSRLTGKDTSIRTEICPYILLLRRNLESV